QINQLFAAFTPIETISLVIAQREGQGADFFRPLCRHAEAIDEAIALLERFHLAADMDVRTSMLPYGKRRLLEIAIAVASRPRVRGSCSSTSRSRGCPWANRRRFWTRSRRCHPTSRYY